MKDCLLHRGNPRYNILRSPFSQQKMTYREDTQTMLYRSKKNPKIKRISVLFPVRDWIAEVTAHIPKQVRPLEVCPAGLTPEAEIVGLVVSPAVVGRGAQKRVLIECTIRVSW